jgi:tetratricopeptide (TPR) repeat protein
MPGISSSGSGCTSKRFRQAAQWVAAIALLCLSAFAFQTAAALNEQGAKALASGDLKTALARFEQAGQLEPDNLQVQFNLGLTLARSGRAKEAILSLERAAAEPTIAPEARYLLGTCYFHLADYARTVDAVKDLTDGPRAEHVLYLLEESHRLRGERAEARDAFRQLNRRFPDSAWTHYLVGNAYENQAQYEQAIAEYKTALERDAAMPNVRFAIGYLYWRQQDMDAAKSWFERELTAQPCHALASFYLGQIARAAQDLKTAARQFGQSIACDATSAESHLRLGMTLTEMGRYQEALGELQRAVRLDPDARAPHYRLALLYRQLGRAADSEAEFETIRRIDAKPPKDSKP